MIVMFALFPPEWAEDCRVFWPTGAERCDRYLRDACSVGPAVPGVPDDARYNVRVECLLETACGTW